MNVQLRYKSTTHNLSLPADASVWTLQNEVYKALKVPPKQQKIIFKGRPITETKSNLHDLQIKNGAKLLLLATDNVSTAIMNECRQQWMFAGPFVKILMHPRHIRADEAIVVLGPPEGAIKGFYAETTSLPNKPFLVRCDHGTSEMSLETDALFFKHRNGIDRIFLSDIVKFGTRPIGDGKYVMLSLETKQRQRINVYFLPLQYERVILQFLCGI